MTHVVTIPVYVIEDEVEIQKAIAEKEKQIRKENEITRMFDRMSIILNTPEINKQIAESKKRVAKYEEELKVLKAKLG